MTLCATRLRLGLQAMLAAGVLAGGVSLFEHRAEGQPGRGPMAPMAKPPVPKLPDNSVEVAAPGTVLMTRQWSADGRSVAGTIWRTFQTWQTDIARTDKGELVPVDPLTSRVGRNNKGEVVRYNYNQPGWAVGSVNFTKLEIYPAKQVHGSSWPSADWQAPDFDDSTWVRDPYPQRELYGLVALRCLRGRFNVLDPAKVNDLTLTLRFRGGAVAYLNGKEIGRAYLPQGDIKPETLAEDYPKEAYVDFDGTLIPQARPGDRNGQAAVADDHREKGRTKWDGRFRPVSVDNATPAAFSSKDPDVAAKYKSRTRMLEVKIPASALRKGVNVLALEIHRAPAWEGMFTSPSLFEGKKSLICLNWADSWWDRSELEDVKLTAAGGSAIVPNVAPVKGLGLFVHPADVELDPSYYADPNEPLAPVRLRGARNGSYSSVLVANSTEPIKRLKAQVTDLKGPAGSIPAAAIEVGYLRPADGFNANNAKEIGEGG